MTTFILHLTLATQSKDRIAAVLSHTHSPSFLYLFISHLSAFLNLSPLFSLSVSLCIYINLSLSNSISLPPSLFLPHSFYISFCLSLSLSISLHHSCIYFYFHDRRGNTIYMLFPTSLF